MIRVVGLRKVFPGRDGKDDVEALRNINLTINDNEFLTILGPSGCGKTTLLRMIGGLLPADAGEILIDGTPVRGPGPERAMVFQNVALMPWATVLANVAFGLELRGVPQAEREEKARRFIRLVGLAGWEHRMPAELSGGMQQRVGLARALAVDPEIILFDEPFSALDPLIRREMQDELLRLQATLHKTSVFITHDFAEALKIGDHIAIMRNGEIVQTGTPEELVLNPMNDYVSAFTKDAPRAKVLTAATIMQPCPPGFDGNDQPSVRADAKLEECLPMLTDHDGPVCVRDNDGALAGIVDRVGMMRALIS
ncbi:MAG: ATP-binding cassette domain-containing protein [Anaerolineales bacterium]